MSETSVINEVARDVLRRLGAMGVQATGVSDDSRKVRRGDLFMAYPGGLADGRRFIDDAVARGAAAVLWEQRTDFHWNPAWTVANLPGEGLRQLCGPLAHAVYQQPSERMSVIAITGTNGKTTISQWLGRAHPRSCAVIGTLGAGFVDALDDTGLTTPEATTLARYLADFASAGAQACALEASSIGIEEGRIDGLRVDVAVFTNLTRDHLDYHGTMEKYADAKRRLFTWPRLRLAVVNLDDPFGVELADCAQASKVIGYTQREGHAERQGVVRAEEIQETAMGLSFRLCTPVGRARVETGIVGRYNLSNMLAVASVLIDAGLKAGEVAERLAGLQPPPGRLEKIGGVGEPLVVVDYSHTPDALQSALNALRGVATARQAKLIAVFGCGGDRDRGKRPLMGEIATRLADQVVLTSDNPRSEQPDAILDEIRVAAPGAAVVADRRQAIHQTVAAAAAGDVILLAGKGHEPYQEIAGVRRPFSDIVEAKAALQARREGVA